MLSDLERGPKAVLRKGRRPRVALQNTFHTMHQRVNDLLTREVLVCTAKHHLVQASSQEHLEASEDMGVQWLKHARHQGRYNARPYVVLTQSCQDSGTEMAHMGVHQ